MIITCPPRSTARDIENQQGEPPKVAVKEIIRGAAVGGTLGGLVTGVTALSSAIGAAVIHAGFHSNAFHPGKAALGAAIGTGALDVPAGLVLGALKASNYPKSLFCAAGASTILGPILGSGILSLAQMPHMDIPSSAAAAALGSGMILAFLALCQERRDSGRPIYY